VLDSLVYSMSGMWMEVTLQLVALLLLLSYNDDTITSSTVLPLLLGIGSSTWTKFELSELCLIGKCSHVLSRIFYDETKDRPDKQFSEIISRGRVRFFGHCCVVNVI